MGMRADRGNGAALKPNQRGSRQSQLAVYRAVRLSRRTRMARIVAARPKTFYFGAAATVIAAAVMTPLPWGAVVFCLVQALGVVAVVVGVRWRRPPTATPWWWFASALCMSALAHAIWSLQYTLGQVSHADTPGAVPTAFAEGWSLTVHPLLAIGLASLVRRTRRQSRWGGVLDAGVVSAGLAAAMWVFLIHPAIDNGAHPTGADLVVLVSRPVLDLVIVTMAVRLVLTTRVRTPSYLLLLSALAGLLLDDCIALFVGVGVQGHPLDHVGWLLWSALLGAAALHPSMARTTALSEWAEPGPHRGRLAIFVLSALVGSTLCVYAASTLDPDEDRWLDLPVLILIAASLSVLAVLRIGLLARLVERRASQLDAHALRLRRALREQQELQGKLQHRALHDSLTGLGNRALLNEQLERVVPHAPDGVHGLLLLDLDGFKDVNDSYGHPAGDELLITVSRRLVEVVDESATVARLGGDEFAILLENTSGGRVHATAERVLAALRSAYPVAGRDLYLSTSIGLLQLDASTTPSEALRDADLALYDAKGAGKNRIAAFHAGLRAERLGLTQMTSGLRRALANSEFGVCYQPVVNLGTQEVAAVEALLRWNGPDGTAVSPSDFIPLAEETGLMVPIGTWVLNQACRDAREWHERYAISLTVNVSGRQLREPDFADVVLGVLRDSGLPGVALVLEITETALMAASAAETDRVIGRLDELRRHGVRIAVDDFGTGYSSLAYLRQLPVDILKIDRAFTPGEANEVGGPRPDNAFTLAILQLSRTLNIDAVAEGVENALQAQLLRDMDCRLAQGFHFARPMTVSALDRFLARKDLADPGFSYLRPVQAA